MGRRSAIALGFLVLALAVYRSSLAGGFLNWDDMAYVTENEELALPFFPAVGRIFGTAHFCCWNPLQRFCYLVLWKSFGAEPMAFRVFSLLVHATCALLAYAVLARWLGRRLPAFLAAVLFLVHPANVENVAWIAELKSLLAATFALAAVLAWLRAADGWRPGRAVALGLFAASLMSKTSAVGLPVLLFLLDRTAGRRPRLTAYLPFVLAAAAGALVQVIASAEEEMIWPLHGGSIATHAATVVAVLSRYVQGLSWPFGHAALHPYPPVTSVTDPRLLAGAAFLVAAGIVSYLSLRRRGRFAVAFAWLLLVLLPTTAVPIPILYADRFLYLAMPFLAGALADLLLRRSGPAAARLPGAAALAAMVLVFGASASRYQAAWRSSLDLWEHSVSVEPESPVAWFNLAKARLARFDVEGGAEAFRRITEIDPGDRLAWQYLALAEALRGRTAEAERIMERILAEDREDPEAWANLATVRERGGDLGGALLACRDGLRACPGAPALEAARRRLKKEVDR